MLDRQLSLQHSEDPVSHRSHQLGRDFRRLVEPVLALTHPSGIGLSSVSLSGAHCPAVPCAAPFVASNGATCSEKALPQCGQMALTVTAEGAFRHR